MTSHKNNLYWSIWVFSPLLQGRHDDLSLTWCENHSSGFQADFQSYSHHQQSIGPLSKMPLVWTIFHNASRSPLAWVVLLKINNINFHWQVSMWINMEVFATVHVQCTASGKCMAECESVSTLCSHSPSIYNI